MNHDPRRLFFDVSFVATSAANTGIHRVVRHLLRELIDDQNWSVIPFCASASGTRMLDRDEVNRNIFAPFGLLTADELATLRPPTVTDRLKRPLRKVESMLVHRWLPQMRESIARWIPRPSWQKFILGSRSEPGSLVNRIFVAIGRGKRLDAEKARLTFSKPLTADDHIFFVDATWHITRFDEILHDIHRQGAHITTVVYDVIPIQFPECVHPGLTSAFEPWFRAVGRYSQRIICISRAEAANVRRVLVDFGLPVPADELKHFDLAASRVMVSEFQKKPSRKVKRQIALIEELSTPCFLMVGTLEPRKNHALALQGFIEYRRDCGMGSLLVA